VQWTSPLKTKRTFGVLFQNFTHHESVVPPHLPPVVPTGGNEGTLLYTDNHVKQEHRYRKTELSYHALDVPSTTVLFRNAAGVHFRFRLIELLWAILVVHFGRVWSTWEVVLDVLRDQVVA
jgi:hypothetical protein